MSAFRASLIVYLLLTSGVAHAIDEPAPPFEGKIASSWKDSLRKRVARVLTGIKRIRPGVFDVGFTVTATGQISAAHATGPKIDADRVVAALRALGQVPPPPDHLSHAMSVRLRIK